MNKIGFFGLNKYRTKYYETKGNIFAFIGLALSLIISWGPLAISIYLIFWQGKILLGILFPFIYWIVLSLYFATLPFVWIIGIFQYGFIESTIFCLLIFFVFALPDIFFSLADRQAMKIANMIDAEERTFQKTTNDLSLKDYRLENTEEDDIITCPYCAEKIDANLVYCSYCDERLMETEKENENKKVSLEIDSYNEIKLEKKITDHQEIRDSKDIAFNEFLSLYCWKCGKKNKVKYLKRPDFIKCWNCCEILEVPQESSPIYKSEEIYNLFLKGKKIGFLHFGDIYEVLEKDIYKGKDFDEFLNILQRNNIKVIK